ncbi:MAG TPA: hypothetical protein VFH73_11250 [Polyangia bacterium]|nr:hypothetical protein [Polyangia bacterium]
MLTRILALSATLVLVGCANVCPDDMVLDRQRSKETRVAFCVSHKDASRALWIEHYPSQKQRKQVCPFVGGRPGGVYQAWHTGGAKFLEGRYENGLKTGRWTQWSPDGSKVGDGEYRDGQLIQGAPVGTSANCESVVW